MLTCNSSALISISPPQNVLNSSSLKHLTWQFYFLSCLPEAGVLPLREASCSGYKRLHYLAVLRQINSYRFLLCLHFL